MRRRRARHPSLGVVLRCHSHAARVQRVAALLREHTDELVIAADARMEAEELALLAGARPDRLVRIPYAMPNQRALEHVTALARSDWLLYLEGDEVPGAALLGRLRELIATRSATHFWLPRRWLWPDATRWLAERPWAPDHQARLALAHPALRSVPGLTHTMFEFAGPSQWLSEPLLHLSLLDDPVGARREKARTREALRPGLPPVGSLGYNHGSYVPEDLQPAPRTLPLDAADRALVEHVTAPGGRVRRGRADRAELHELAQIDASWRLRPRGPQAFEARIELADPDLRFIAGEGRVLHVEVTNAGDSPWYAGGAAPGNVFASYHWRDPTGRMIVLDGLRTPLPCTLEPGDRTVVGVSVSAPDPGDYELEIDLVSEHVRWFESGLALVLTVTPSSDRSDVAP